LINIFILIYNISLDECPSINSLLRTIPDDRVRVKIRDNSPHFFNKKYLDGLRRDIQEWSPVAILEYEWDGNNEPLSKTYNRFCESVLNFGNDCVMILDQDTCLEKNLFSVMREFYDHGCLNVPTVLSMHSGHIISPRRQKTAGLLNNTKEVYFLENQESKSGKFFLDDFFAIGSGLIIPQSLWAKGLRFDENVKFYGVDTEFCMDCSKMCGVINVLPLEFQHDISVEGDISFFESVTRIKLYSKYWEYQLHKRDGKNRVFSYFWVKLFLTAWVAKKAVRSWSEKFKK